MADDKYDPGEIQDVDSYAGGLGGNQEGLTFSMIVHMHMNRIVKKASNELRGGYEDITIKEVAGQAYRFARYVPDTREEYSNAVDALADLTFSYFDQEIKDEEIKLEEELKTSKKDCMVKNYKGKEELDEDEYRELKFKSKRKLFRALCSFIKRQNYFGEETAVF